MNQNKQQKILNLESKIAEYFEDTYFDFQSMTAGKVSINESQIIRLVTKISVGLVTVWWSSMELKSVLKSIKHTRS